jgi:pimeloyl-ACP methyl ester carboxylesterase
MMAMREYVRSSILSLSREQFHEISYTEWGADGDRGVVVCVHGLTRQGRDFDFLAQRLADQGYRIVCPDVVGRGLSGKLVYGIDYDLDQYVLDMTVLLARLNVSEVSWVGTSLGGLIGILIGGLRNSPVRRLVVNDIGPNLPINAVLRIGNYVRNAPSAFPNLQSVESYFREILQPFGPLTDEHWRHLARHSVKRDEAGNYVLRYDRRLTLGFKPPWHHRHRLWSAWDKIECPVLILRGATSDLLQAKTAAEMLQRNARARLETIKDCGHAPALMDEEQISLVAEWLAARSPNEVKVA